MTNDPTICPGCGNAKTRRAKLCTNCRRRANAVGADVVTHIGEAAVPVAAPTQPRTPIQNTIYHARITDLAALQLDPGYERAELRRVERDVKNAVIRQASRMFGRIIKSSTELTEFEMEQLLEWLDDQLAEADRSTT